MSQITICGQIILSSTERPLDRVFTVLAALVRSDGSYLNLPPGLSKTTGSDGTFEFNFSVTGDQIGYLLDAHIRVHVADHRDGGIAQTTTRFSSRTTTHPLLAVPNVISRRSFDITSLFNSYSEREQALNTSFGTHRGVAFINNTPFARFGPLCQRAFSLYSSAGAAVPGASPSPDNYFYLSIPIIKVS